MSIRRKSLFRYAQWPNLDAWECVLWVILGTFLCGVLFIQLYPYLFRWWDTYYYFQLGHSILDNFRYETNCIRDISGAVRFPQTNRTYQPLHPLLLGLSSQVFSSDIISGLFVALTLVGVGAWLVFLVARETSADKWPIPFLAYFFFIGRNQAIRLEIGGALSMPTAFVFVMACIVVAARSASRKNISFLSCVALAAFAVLAALSRWELAAFAAALPVTMALIWRGRYGWRKAVSAASVCLAFELIFASPWALRNYYNFGAFFASTGSNAVCSLHPVGIGVWTVSDGGTDLGCIFTSEWLKTRLAQAAQTFKMIRQQCGLSGLSITLPLIMFWKRFNYPQRAVFALSAAHFVSTWLAISTTHWIEPRYFSIHYFWIVLWFAIGITTLRQMGRIRRTQILGPAILFSAAIFICLIVMEPEIQWARFTKPHPELAIWRRNQERYVTYADSIRSKDWGNFVFAVPNAEEFTYFTGLKSVRIIEPIDSVNYSKEFRLWFEKWKPDRICMAENARKRSGLNSLTPPETWIEDCPIVQPS